MKASGGSGNFAKVDLLKNGQVIKTWTETDFDDVSNPAVVHRADASSDDYFYVRLYKKNEWRWAAISSPIFVSGNIPIFSGEENEENNANASSLRISKEIKRLRRNRRIFRRRALYSENLAALMLVRFDSKSQSMKTFSPLQIFQKVSKVLKMMRSLDNTEIESLDIKYHRQNGYPLSVCVKFSGNKRNTDSTRVQINNCYGQLRVLK